MPNLKSIKQIFRTIHRLPQPALLRTAQMHKVGTLGKLPCQFTGIILFTRTQ